MNVWLQSQADDFDVLDFAALQATPSAGELFDAEFDKLYSVLRKDITSPLVVDGPLYAARYSADRSPTVKERHRLPVLPFVVFDDQSEFGVIGIDWEFPA